MKIIVVSDTHRRLDAFQKMLGLVGSIDLLIHCGDSEGQEDTIAELAGCQAVMVSGNNDYFSRLPREREFILAGIKTLVVHGHQYGVNMGYEMLLEEGMARDVKLIACGHTHRPAIVQREGITLINPGSLTAPRQEGRRSSYILIEVDVKGEFHYSIGYLN